MISIQKLRKLPSATRLRKVIRLLDGFVQYQTLPDPAYLRGLYAIVSEANPEIEFTADVDRDRADDAILRQLDSLRYRLREVVNVPVGDWDLFPPAGYGSRETEQEARGPDTLPISVYVESIRSPFNVGSIIRTAAAFGISRVVLSPDSPAVGHPRVIRSARGTIDFVNVERARAREMDDGLHPIVALELGGAPIEGFLFPPAGTLAVGSEEMGLSQELLTEADYRVSIPMAGQKASLNVGVACGIALHAWCAQARMPYNDA